VRVIIPTDWFNDEEDQTVTLENFINVLNSEEKKSKVEEERRIDELKEKNRRRSAIREYKNSIEKLESLGINRDTLE
jgi:hypothetical protein